MASKKRKMSTTATGKMSQPCVDTVKILVSKKKPKVETPFLTEHYIETVLPTMSSTDFENYMLKIGPSNWKKATQIYRSTIAKQLVNRILRHVSLQPAFSVFLTHWEMEEEPALFLFEMGLGAYIRQAVVPHSAKNVYMFSMRMDATEASICPILPDLQHKHHYFCLSTDFAVKKDLKKNQQRLNPALLTPEEIFFKKLSSALACVKLHRWSECFAFSLSALDDYKLEFECLHDVLCYIALSGTKTAMPLDWCCRVLEDAKKCATALDHTWKRILVFQSILVQNGFFDLEFDLFHKAQDIFLQVSDHFQTFLIQHILAKLLQVEFNLVFQFLRQNFHDACQDFCKKEPCFKQSSFVTQKLLNQMDTLAQAVTVKGVKEYFKGYFYLYSTMLQLHVQKSERNTLFVQLSMSFFQLARDLMKTNECFYLDLTFMISFLKKSPMTTQTMQAHFEKKSVSQNTEEASHFFYRTMLITMYWDNYFQPFPYTMLATIAREMEMKLSNKKGYRIPLLTSCIEIGNISTAHFQDPNTPQDYPNICPSKEQCAWLKQASQYWEKEAEGLKEKQQQQPTTGQQNEKIKKLSAQSIINKNKRAEQVFAFGKQLVEAWTFI